MANSLPGITVIIPTFKRTVDLDRCLRAIEAQRLQPYEVLIPYRLEDEETVAYLARTDRPCQRAIPLRCDKPGQVFALTLGIDSAKTDYVAITDDDSAPHPEWLERIVAHFQADPLVAGVGGKDHIFEDGKWLEGTAAVVGKVLWSGGRIGNHHLGYGGARYVETLKGVNMSYRRSALGDLRPDARLRGKGAQVGNDMQLSLSLVARGYKLVYDPQVLVDHYPGARPKDEARNSFHPGAHSDATFNNTLAILEYLGSQRWGRLRQISFFAYNGLRGTRRAPGLLMLVVGWLTGYPEMWGRFKVTFAAYREAIKATASGKQQKGSAI